MDEKRNKYLLKKYGITEAEYEARFEEQGGCCGICKRPQSTFTRRLAVDHDHGWPYIKLTRIRFADCWQVQGTYIGKEFAFKSRQVNKAVRTCRQAMKRASVRGLLCPFCNQGIQGFSHDSVRLMNASQYLARHQQG